MLLFVAAAAAAAICGLKLNVVDPKGVPNVVADVIGVVVANLLIRLMPSFSDCGNNTDVCGCDIRLGFMWCDGIVTLNGACCCVCIVILFGFGRGSELVITTFAGGPLSTGCLFMTLLNCKAVDGGAIVAGVDMLLISGGCGVEGVVDIL